MTKQTKWALGVLAFVVTATVARRVGQFEMKDQAEKQIAVLQEKITKAQKESESWHRALKAVVDNETPVGEDQLSVVNGIEQGIREYRACRQGDRDSCDHVMLMSGDSPNEKEILYNAQGNYKKNAWELFERMGSKQ
jgi:hypothetical protein